MKKCCRLVDISCNYNLDTSVRGISIHKACGAVKGFPGGSGGKAVKTALRHGPGAGIAEINYNNRLKKPIATGKSPQILYGKNKWHWTRHLASLIITGGKTIKMITRNQIPAGRMDIHKSLQTVNVREGQKLIEPLYKVGGNGHCQKPLEKTASTCQNISIQES